MNEASQHAFEAARSGECCNTVLPNELKFNATPTHSRRLVRNAWLFIGKFLPFESVVKRAYLALGLGKCFTRACLPILFGEMSQKPYKITVPKGDICKHVACVASVSVRFRRKERGTRVKDREKSGASKRAGRGWGRKEGNACRQTPGF